MAATELPLVETGALQHIEDGDAQLGLAEAATAGRGSAVIAAWRHPGRRGCVNRGKCSEHVRGWTWDSGGGQSVCASQTASVRRRLGMFVNTSVAGVVAGVMAGVVACATADGPALPELPALRTVERVELERYLGAWYEIASYPQSFQRGCTATTATYSPGDDGEIAVVNSCRKDRLDGELDEALGRARVVDEQTNAKLEVSFFGPFWADYWIIDLGEDYEYAVVGHPSREYLWILAREPRMEAGVYEGILARLVAQRYDTSKLAVTLQPGA